MPITFNTNLAALTSQRYLGVASDKTKSSLAKLSSGSRVPTAKDDAAALAIGSKLRAEVAGLNQASNNASQAVSLLQIADGALSTTGDILVRMKALAVQASSGQLSDSDRSLLNQEFSALQNEVDRISQVTNFNGNQLLNGGDVTESYTDSQAGYLAGKGITATFDTNVTDATSVFRVSYAFVDNTTDNNAINETDTAKLTVTNLTTGAAQTIDIASLVRAQSGEVVDTDSDGVHFDTTLSQGIPVGKNVAVNFSSLGVTLNLDSTFNVTGNINQTVAFSDTAGTGGTVAGVTAAFQGGARLTTAQVAALSTLNAVDGKLSINTTTTTTTNSVAIAATTGLQFSLDGVTYATNLAAITPGAGKGFYVATTGSTTPFMYVNFTSMTSTGTAGSGSMQFDLSGILSATESAGTAKTFNFKVGTGTSVNDSIGFTLSAVTTSALGINSSTVNISTAPAAANAITALNAAITTVSSRRADIGASQSRLSFAAASVAVAIENTTAAQSSLLDVDVSSEITNFTSQQVLLQAGVSLLAQANQQPALLLRLLQ